jgi:hypothetical protein
VAGWLSWEIPIRIPTVTGSANNSAYFPQILWISAITKPWNTPRTILRCITPLLLPRFSTGAVIWTADNECKRNERRPTNDINYNNINVIAKQYILGHLIRLTIKSMYIKRFRYYLRGYCTWTDVKLSQSSTLFSRDKKNTIVSPNLFSLLGAGCVALICNESWK